MASARWLLAALDPFGVSELGCDRSSELSFQHVACRQAFRPTRRQVRSVASRSIPSYLRRSAAPQPVERPPSGPQWLHEIKLDGYRMAARIDNGRVQLLTWTGLDWTEKYPIAIAALANLNIKTAYLDGELCGVDEAGLPTFAPHPGGDRRRTRCAVRLLVAGSPI